MKLQKCNTNDLNFAKNQLDKNQQVGDSDGAGFSEYRDR